MNSAAAIQPTTSAPLPPVGHLKVPAGTPAGASVGLPCSGSCLNRFATNSYAIVGHFLVIIVATLALGVGETAAGTFRDALGREVSVEVPARRIVSLAPNITEMLFAVGLDREIVGVTTFCDWPEKARTKTRIGGFINPSLEAIVSLAPDLVLATADGNSERDVRRIEELGIPVYVTDSRSFEDVMSSISDIGRLAGRGGEAAALVERMKERKMGIEDAVAGRERPRVLVVLDSAPLMAAGAGTFIDEMVSSAGGQNVLDDGRVKYPVLGLESLVVTDPDVIVDYSGPMAGMEGRRPFLEAFEKHSLRAVGEGRLYEIRESDFFLPGPRIVDSLEELAGMLHPGAIR